MVILATKHHLPEYNVVLPRAKFKKSQHATLETSTGQGAIGIQDNLANKSIVRDLRIEKQQISTIWFACTTYNIPKRGITQRLEPVTIMAQGRKSACNMHVSIYVKSGQAIIRNQKVRPQQTLWQTFEASQTSTVRLPSDCLATQSDQHNLHKMKF